MSMFTGTEDHEITLSAGAALTAKFRLLYGTLATQAQYFSRAGIEALLDQDGAVGIKIYNGMTNDLIPLPTKVLVAVDADGTDILDLVLDHGSKCPPNCSSTNDLNS